MGVQQNEDTAKLILELCWLYSLFWHVPQIVSPSCFSPDIKRKHFPYSNLYPTFQDCIVVSDISYLQCLYHHISAPLQGIIKTYVNHFECLVFYQVYEIQEIIYEMMVC